MTKRKRPPGMAAAVRRAKLRERERIARLLMYEGENAPCADDGAVYRSAAWLVRGNFSYEEAERLEVAADAGRKALAEHQSRRLDPEGGIPGRN